MMLSVDKLPKRRSYSQTHLSDRKPSTTASYVFRTPEYDEKKQKHSRKHWNQANEETAKWVAQRAGGFKWIHGQCVMSYHRWYNVVGVGAIIANAVAVALNVPYVIVCQEAFNGLKIAAIIIASFVTIVMAFQQFKDFGGLRKEHITSEANYAALYDTIRNELQKEAKNREDANDYLKWITKQMTDLKSSSPIIPPSIIAKYRQMIDGQNLPDPEGIDEIYINRPISINKSSSGEMQEIVVDDVRSNSLRIPPVSPADMIALERWTEQEQ